MLFLEHIILKELVFNWIYRYRSAEVVLCCCQFFIITKSDPPADPVYTGPLGG